MGNSTITLQSVVDSVSTIGDLNPVLNNTGGYSSEPALGISNDVILELIAARFNWKWNRLRVPPFPLVGWQQDYPTVNLYNVGWGEGAARVDVNNTSIPKPTRPIMFVREIPITSQTWGWPNSICWLPNDQLEYDAWPGPDKEFQNPIGASPPPHNPRTAILDANNNILLVTSYGTTGQTAPVLPANSVAGTTIVDGTVTWTVCDPNAAGFRVWPITPQAGNVWLIRAFVQKKAQLFTSLSQTIDPIPDDYSKWFKDGFIAYAHRHSTNPAVQAKFPMLRQQWLGSMLDAAKQGNRETEGFGFYPAAGVMSDIGSYEIGPAWPFPNTWGN
jgi:hypothetical protein